MLFPLDVSSLCGCLACRCTDCSTYGTSCHSYCNAFCCRWASIRCQPTPEDEEVSYVIVDETTEIVNCNCSSIECYRQVCCFEVLCAMKGTESYRMPLPLHMYDLPDLTAVPSESLYPCTACCCWTESCFCSPDITSCLTVAGRGSCLCGLCVGDCVGCTPLCLNSSNNESHPGVKHLLCAKQCKVPRRCLNTNCEVQCCCRDQILRCSPPYSDRLINFMDGSPSDSDKLPCLCLPLPFITLCVDGAASCKICASLKTLQETSKDAKTTTK